MSISIRSARGSNCAVCGCDISDRVGSTLYCNDCGEARHRERQLAYRHRITAERKESGETVKKPVRSRARKVTLAHWRLDTPLACLPDALRDTSPHCIDCGAPVPLPAYFDTLHVTTRCARCRDLHDLQDDSTELRAIVDGVASCDSFLKWQGEVA